MVFLFRVVSNPRWSPPSWINIGDVPADVLDDLRAKNNELSVWVVQGDQSNLDVVIAAIASNRDRLDKLDYALIDETILDELAIKRHKSDGVTPHALANTQLHEDLVELTVRKVADLAVRMMSLQRQRIPETKVKRMLTKALEDGVLDRSKVTPKLLTQIEQR